MVTVFPCACCFLPRRPLQRTSTGSSRGTRTPARRKFIVVIKSTYPNPRSLARMRCACKGSVEIHCPRLDDLNPQYNVTQVPLLWYRKGTANRTTGDGTGQVVPSP